MGRNRTREAFVRTIDEVCGVFSCKFLLKKVCTLNTSKLSE